MLRNHSAASERASGAIGSTIPAQFTRIDAGPTHRAVASARSCTCRSSATSAVCASAWPPERLMPFTTSSSSGALRDARTTEAPMAASVAEPLEQPRAQCPQALAHGGAEAPVHRERLPQAVEGPGVDGADLEARRLGLERHAAREVHRALRTPAEARALEPGRVLHPERAHAQRTVEPLVSEEGVRVGAEGADVDRVLAQRLCAVDDHRSAGLVGDARGVRDRQNLAALATDE